MKMSNFSKEILYYCNLLPFQCYSDSLNKFINKKKDFVTFTNSCKLKRERKISYSKLCSEKLLFYSLHGNEY